MGEAVTLSYPLALPEVAGDDSAETPVSLAERLEHPSDVLLPWYNARLMNLHREDVLAEAPSWAKPVWKHGGLGEAPAAAPSRVGRCALETVGRVVASQAARREAFVALRAVWGLDDASAAKLGPEAPGWRQAEGPEAERLLAAGEPYPVVVQARESGGGPGCCALAGRAVRVGDGWAGGGIAGGAAGGVCRATRRFGSG